MTETEFFITARSFAAPFVSDESTAYVTAETAAEALEKFAASYGHPMGLYSAEAWTSADDYHKSGGMTGFVAQWLSNHEIAKQEAIAEASSHAYFGRGPGDFDIDGKPYTVDDPKGGRVV